MMHPQIIKKNLEDEAEKLGLTEYGITDTETGSAFVCLFPYYIKNIPKGNLSRYACVTDYHKICKDYLNKIAAAIDAEFEIYADVSPFDEVGLAKKAGLGIIGKNRLLINKKYGSYVFIGIILIKNVFLENSKAAVGECAGCGKCVQACPLGALRSDKFNKELCLSYITQKRGELSETDAAAIKNSGKIWGCDICSEVCVHNKDLPDTPIREFYKIMPSLNKSDIAGLSQRQFKETYSDRAFTWRGKNVLLRNLELME